VARLDELKLVTPKFVFQKQHFVNREYCSRRTERSEINEHFSPVQNNFVKRGGAEEGSFIRRLRRFTQITGAAFPALARAPARMKLSKSTSKTKSKNPAAIRCGKKSALIDEICG